MKTITLENGETRQVSEEKYQELLKSGYESIVLQSMTDKELIELWEELSRR